MDQTKTGKLIAQVRKEKNLTQKELAQELHVSDRAVSEWERGAGLPGVSLLELLAEALGLNVLDLLRGRRQKRLTFVLSCPRQWKRSGKNGGSPNGNPEGNGATARNAVGISNVAGDFWLFTAACRSHRASLYLSGR